MLHGFNHATQNHRLNGLKVDFTVISVMNSVSKIYFMAAKLSTNLIRNTPHEDTCIES